MAIKKQAKLSREEIIEKYQLKAQGLGREQIIRPEENGFIFKGEPAHTAILKVLHWMW